jgi:hypothetical protein
LVAFSKGKTRIFQSSADIRTVGKLMSQMSWPVTDDRLRNLSTKILLILIGTKILLIPFSCTSADFRGN